MRDAVFLHRYSEPVLLVLHEVAPTWTGNLRARKDTMVVTALSVNVVHKRLTLLWSARDLPSDACRLSAVPLGGALVLCRSLIKYVSQVCGLLPPAVAQILSSSCSFISQTMMLKLQTARDGQGNTVRGAASQQFVRCDRHISMLVLCRAGRVAWQSHQWRMLERMLPPYQWMRGRPSCTLLSDMLANSPPMCIQ